MGHFCEDTDIDIIPIVRTASPESGAHRNINPRPQGFVNVFPDQSHGYPGTNFGNKCGNSTFNNLNGSSSPLLSDCPSIGPDITKCQAAGKKILLSLGGAIPNNQELDSDASAVDFANFLWKAFGPKCADYSGPRPFGDAVVDGFDFDIESNIPGQKDISYQSRGYATMIKTLRSLYALESGKDYYISGAPQCIVPDSHLGDAISSSWFDFLFVQFYNTQSCSVRKSFIPVVFIMSLIEIIGPRIFRSYVRCLRRRSNEHIFRCLGEICGDCSQ